MASNAVTTPAVFEQTDRLKELVVAINSIKSDKFSLVLTKIIQSAGQPGKRPFSPTEEAQLLPMLNVDLPTLSLVLEGCAYLYETAAYNNFKSQTFGPALLAAGIGETQAVTLAQVWTAESASLIAKMRGRILGAPQVLQGVSWRLTLGLGDTGSSEGVSASTSTASSRSVVGGGGGGGGSTTTITTTAAAPSATMDFIVASADGTCGTNSGTKTVSVEFSRDGLLGFLSKLDVIQQQLDSLS